MHFLCYKITETAKKILKDPVPYLGLELTKHVVKSQIRLVRQSLP
jgi:hypothetical protein